MPKNSGKQPKSRGPGRPQKYDEPTGRIACRLPQSTIDGVDAAAAAAGQTRSDWIAEQLRRALSPQVSKRSRRNGAATD